MKWNASSENVDAGGCRWRNTAGGRQGGGGGPTAGKHAAAAAVDDAVAGGRDGQVGASGDGAAATGTRRNSNAGADF